MPLKTVSPENQEVGVLLGTGNFRKATENAFLLKASFLDLKLRVDSANPGRFKNESDDLDPGVVASDKAMTIFKFLGEVLEGFSIAPENSPYREIVTMDAATFQTDAKGIRTPLQRLDRQIPDDMKPAEKARKLQEIRLHEQQKMIERCADNFDITWYIAHALLLTDTGLVETHTNVYKAQFERIPADEIRRYYVPQTGDSGEVFPALLIGPQYSFAENSHRFARSRRAIHPTKGESEISTADLVKYVVDNLIPQELLPVIGRNLFKNSPANTSA